MKKGPAVIRMALLLAFLLGSLTLVVWRQSHALVVLRDLDGLREERVIQEARRAGLVRRVEQLESRSRVSNAAQTRLGMRVPTGDEIVILPMGVTPPAALATAEPSERARGSGEG